MACFEYHLGGNLVGRAAECVRARGDVFREPEVNELQLAILTYHQIFGFEVTLDQVEHVHEFERECDLRGLEFGHWFCKFDHFSQLWE